MPYKPVQAILYAVLLWITGFIWGSVVFMTPALKAVAPIPYISSNPAISFPILIVWIFLTWAMAKNYLKSADDKPAEGLKFGIVLAVTNFILDLIVLVILLKAGWGYFASASVLLAYTLLIVIPWMVGRSKGVTPVAGD
jgi:hypothetical protein